jgi:hypothetical protein
MNLDWMMLCNYAEAAPNGLLYIAGGGYDTITVNAPLENASPEVFTIMQGTLVIRLLFHQTETGRDHTFEVAIADEDGRQIGKAEGNVRVERLRGLPVGWPQNVNLAIPLTGIGLPRPGLYTISVSVNRQHVGDRPFRVLKGY